MYDGVSARTAYTCTQCIVTISQPLTQWLESVFTCFRVPAYNTGFTRNTMAPVYEFILPLIVTPYSVPSIHTVNSIVVGNNTLCKDLKIIFERHSFTHYKAIIPIRSFTTR